MATATTRATAASSAASTASASALAAVQRLLAAGQTSAIEPATGHLQALVATCPEDGGRATVRRVSREGRGPIFEVIMRCTQCATDFVAAPESLRLQ